jgi:heme/copper-type cytochrome/quinol oxidase subunit 1
MSLGITIFPIICLIINWMFIIWNYPINKNIPILFVIGYIITFFVGTIISIVLAADNQVHILNSAGYITSQFHYLVAIGVIFLIFGGFYACSKKIIGVYTSEILAQIYFWSFFL